MAKLLLIDPSGKDIYGNYLVQRDVYPHTGLLTLGTVAIQRGHTVKVIHMVADNITLQSLPAVLKQFNPDFVGVTVVTFQLAYARKVLEVVENNSDALTIVGGPHVSACPESLNADYIVRGEGERALMQIIDGHYPSGHIINGEPIEDLNTLPALDLSLTDIRRFSGIYPPGPLPSMPLMFSRGCPFNCSFCSQSVFGHKVRYRGVGLLARDLINMKINGVKEVFFQDDTFNADINYAKFLCNTLLSFGLHKDMKFRARLRANEKLLDRELLDLMKRANFWCIFYGVESGNQTMLDNAIGKHLTIEEIKRAFRLTREAGIKAEASFIIGLPGETNETIQDSINLYKEIKPDWCSFNRAIPFPGTRFEEEIKAKGHLLNQNYEDYQLNRTLVRTDALTPDELEKWAVYCDNMILREKIKGLARNPVNAYHVVKDSLTDLNGAKRLIKRAFSAVS